MQYSVRELFRLNGLLAAALWTTGVAASPALPAEVPRVVESCAVLVERQPVRRGANYWLALSLHTFRGARWSQEEVSAAGRESVALLAQCDVELSRLELCTIEAPRGFHFYFTPLARELLRRMPVAKPSVFFVEDTRNRPAFDAEAIGRGNAKTRPELADTVWVVYGARDLPQALAHELVHVLSDSGDHSEEPDNLMGADTSPRATRLTDAQCERLRTRGETNGLLQAIKQ